MTKPALNQARRTRPSFESAAGRIAVWDALGKLRKASDLREIEATVRHVCRANGFDHFGFAAKRRDRAPEAGGFPVILDFPQSWARRYEWLAKPSSDINDPVIEHVTKAQLPTTWDCKGRVTFTEPRIARHARGLLGSAGEHGLAVGMTIPLFAPDFSWSFLVMTSRSAAPATELLSELPWACLLGQTVMLSIRRLTSATVLRRQPLTSRESEVLRWCAAGKTSWEIGRILSISEATVNFHVKNAAREFGTCSRQATCSQAIAENLLDL